MADKLCIDCANYHTPVMDEDCWRPTGKFSPVTGSPLTENFFAWNERHSTKTLFGRRRCGPDAIYFVARSKGEA